MVSCRAVDAVHDADPAEAAKWRYVRRRAVAMFQAHGYHEVQPSPLEPRGIAARTGLGTALSLSDGTELRPDPMASVARMFIDESNEKFARWFTAGNSFDARPIGRHKWNAWHSVSGMVFGAEEPAADAEVAALCLALASDLGLSRPEVVLGTLGDAGDLDRYLATTAELRGLVCGDCKSAKYSPLRFLTCDDDGCRALAQSAPVLREFVSVPALKHHEAVLATLESSGFVVRDEPRLGFGAGRYGRTLVELRAREPDGRELVVARGGRRDALIFQLGARPLPSVGVTLGLARAAICTPGDEPSWELRCELYIAARGAAARAWALKTAAAERARGFRVDIDLREVGWAEQLKRADDVRARVVVVVGDVDRKKGEVAIRDMETRETRHIPVDTLSAELKRLLR
jgi:histidyl-tRNA synthetase